MSKKIADKGATAAFLRLHVAVQQEECLIWPYATNAKGYGLAVIDGRQMTASRWMCVLAHGEPKPPRNYAAHNCGKPVCVNPAHLRWATHAENMEDRNLHQTSNHGERNGKTTLTADDVRYIRSAPDELKPLMEKFGLSKHGLSKIRSRKRWGHVS